MPLWPNWKAEHVHCIEQSFLDQWRCLVSMICSYTLQRFRCILDACAERETGRGKTLKGSSGCNPVASKWVHHPSVRTLSVTRIYLLIGVRKGMRLVLPEPVPRSQSTSVGSPKRVIFDSKQGDAPVWLIILKSSMRDFSILFIVEATHCANSMCLHCFISTGDWTKMYGPCLKADLLSMS